MSELGFATTATTAATTNQAMPRQAWADWAGMVASIGCAIHCAAMPLVFAYLPALGLSWLADEGFHRVMAIVCFGLAMAAFVPGWRKHRSFAPIAWGIAGLTLLNLAAFGLEDGCCPSCHPQAAVCADAECESCEAVVTTETAGTSLAGFPVALITPLGGLLLVVGHVVNHTKNCKCKCCAVPGCEDTDGAQSTVSL